MNAAGISWTSEITPTIRVPPWSNANTIKAIYPPHSQILNAVSPIRERRRLALPSAAPSARSETVRSRRNSASAEEGPPDPPAWPLAF